MNLSRVTFGATRMPASQAIGIDLGASRCAVARADQAGHSAIIRNAQGDVLVPSVVYFEDDELLVGRAAKLAANGQPGRAAELAKRDLGQAAYSRAIGGELLPAEVVEACLLKRLCADLALGAAPAAVVLSAPACFDQSQRRAVADVARIAGLDLLATLRDPLAVALAFAEAQNYLHASDKPGCRALVFDLGGGKLDVSIIEIKPRRLRTLAVGGDARLGGRDWDLRLVDYLAQQFAERFGEDPRYDMVSVRRLIEQADEAKQTLSSRSQARVHVERSGHVAELTVTRAQFEDLTADLVKRTIAPCQQLLDRAGLAWRDVGQLLLVGGASRMPMIASALESLSGLRPATFLHPDEAVARGAALYAEQLLARREKRASKVDVEITDLTAFSFGVEWYNPQLQRAENVVLMPCGTELPCGTMAKAQRASNVPGPIVVQLLEGESRRADGCARVARLLIDGVGMELPWNTAVEVSYQFSADGFLNVAAQLPATRQAISVTLERERGLSDEKIAGWRAALAGSEGLVAILAALAKLGAPRLPAPLATADSPPTPADEEQMLERDDDSPGKGFSFDPEAEIGPIRRKKRRSSSRKIAILVGGYVISALLGLAMGYYILMYFDPRYNWYHLRLPGLDPLPSLP